jgi:hypothetical protein
MEGANVRVDDEGPWVVVEEGENEEEEGGVGAKETRGPPDPGANRRREEGVGVGGEGEKGFFPFERKDDVAGLFLS